MIRCIFAHMDELDNWCILYDLRGDSPATEIVMVDFRTSFFNRPVAQTPAYSVATIHWLVAQLGPSIAPPARWGRSAPKHSVHCAQALIELWVISCNLACLTSEAVEQTANT